MVKRDSEDSWVWLGEGNELYSVMSAYDIIKCEIRRDEDKLFYKLWRVKALSSTQFCAWTVMLDKLPTIENLEKFSIIVNISR